ncbi:MAG: hypothetical protein IJU65_09420 [Desulfovibrio sp.]|nr:hypothetical protein [Desulfovibrio sp.]
MGDILAQALYIYNRLAIDEESTANAKAFSFGTIRGMYRHLTFREVCHEADGYI